MNYEKKNIKISIEGIPGSGKTTVQKELKNKLISNQYKFDFIEEPVNKWKDLNGHNLLNLMYDDIKKWNFAFNMYSYLTVLQNHQKISETKEPTVSILERSIYSGKYCFLETMSKSDYNHPVEYEILDTWFEWIIKNNPCELDIIFYLKTEPSVAFERIIKRGRPEETSIQVEYLKLLDELHDRWLVLDMNENKSSIKYYRPAIVKVIDGNRDIQSVVESIIQEIEPKINILN